MAYFATCLLCVDESGFGIGIVTPELGFFTIIAGVCLCVAFYGIDEVREKQTTHLTSQQHPARNVQVRYRNRDEQVWWLNVFLLLLLLLLSLLFQVGEILEDPFGTNPNDLPVDAMGETFPHFPQQQQSLQTLNVLVLLGCVWGFVVVLFVVLGVFCYVRVWAVL